LKRTRASSHQSSLLVLKRLAQAMSFIFIFGLLGYVLLWCFDPANCPISNVKLIGDRKYLALDDIEKTIVPEASLGFFRLKVSSLQQQLLSLPWIKQVQIRRVWPHELVINFEEKIPAARWGSNGLLSIEGELFYPLAMPKGFLNLPLLQGPEGRELQVWQQYLVMKETLLPIHLGIKQLVLAPRGAWHLQLSNDITVILGTNDTLMRLEQFIIAYQKDLHLRAANIATADLRYTSGMAIGWRNEYAKG
jgi:cell division protein FtsQ